MKKSIFAFGCLLVAVCSLTLAAEPAAKSERIPKELEQLGWMVGDWAGLDGKADVQIHCEWVKNNHFLQSTINASTPGGFEFQGVQVIGWDPEAGQIRSWLFDSNGGFAGGLWQRANRQWVTDSKFVRDDGARGSVTAVCTFVNDDTFKWKFVNRNDQGATLFDIDEVTLHRQSAAKEGANPAGAEEPGAVTAIDIVLEPDATMVKHAEAANERLLKEFPKGFALDKTHQPHISCLQRYVKTADLDKVYEAVGKVLAEEKPTAWKLKAYRYYFIPWKEIGLAGIVVEPTDDLIRYQKKLIDAIAPFTVKTGTAAAFVTTKEDPEINQPTIDYVMNFVPNETGKKFNPHVTIGVATQDYLEKMVREKFEAFTFSPAGASVYHLGNFGTAREKLKSWELKP